MERNNTGKPIEVQATGVPNDFADPNHPHFPHDPEAQLPERPYKYVPFTSKKSTRIVLVVIFALLSYVAAALIGGKVGMNLAKRPASNEAVYSTTTVFTTTVVPYPTNMPAATCAFVGDKNYMLNYAECEKDCNNFASSNKTAKCKLNDGLKFRCEVCDIASKTSTDIVTKTVEAPSPAATCSFVGTSFFISQFTKCNKECNNFVSDKKTANCKTDFALKLRCEVCEVVSKTSEAIITKTVESPIPAASCSLAGDTFSAGDFFQCNQDCYKNFNSEKKTAMCKLDAAASKAQCEVCDAVSKTAEAASSSTAPSPPPTAVSTPPPPPPPKKVVPECFWTGRWSTQKECNEKCEEMNDKSTDEPPICNEERGFFKCRTCKAAPQV